MASVKRVQRFLAGNTGQLALTLIPLVLAPLASAGHISDGFFTNPTEWTGPNVNKTFFAPASGGSGNAWLYAEQSSGLLYLMYDYVGNTNPFETSSFFDVFFQVASTDYGIHITQGGFTAFEKPVSILSPFNPDGSFNFNVPPWSLLTSGDPDFARADFHGALGFGMSLNNGTPHWMAEFDVTINNANNGPANGLYSPNPAFWSASTGGGFNAAASADPPITSAIFTLNPNGTILVVPDLPNGAPIMEDSVSSIPEPPTLWTFGSGALVLLALRWNRTLYSDLLISPSKSRRPVKTE